MRKFLCITLFLLLMFPLSASALDYTNTFYFSGSAADGTGSATMDITILGNTLTADLFNTSPTTLNSSIDPNAPGITFFGFDLDPEALGTPSLWTMKAYDSDNNQVTIGGNPAAGTGDWELTVGGQYAGIELEYISSSGTPPQIKGALYNPDAKGSSALAADPNYFTQATLTMDFSIAPIFIEDFANDSPFVRMQNVGGDTNGDGESGDGSLKLTPVPEPSTMIISGLFLFGAGFYVRKKLHKNS